MFQRQGDVLIKKISALPKGLKRTTTNVLVYGESTGHSHKLVGGKVLLDPTGLMFLDIANKAQIVHEEHKTINLTKGKYAVIRQREYVSSDMVKVVVD